MKNLHLLILEDDPMDAALIKKVLERSGMTFDTTIVSSKKDFIAAIANNHYDTILADNSLPQFNAGEAFEAVKSSGLNTPFILVTGTVSEEFAVAIMKAGASDYILKDRLQRLPNAVLSAVNKRTLEQLHLKNMDELIRREALMKKSEQLAHIGSWEVDMTTYTTSWSDGTYSILEYEPGEIKPSLPNFLIKLHPEDLPVAKQVIEESIDRHSMQKFTCRLVTNDGAIKNLENEIYVTRDENGAVRRLNGLSRDITETSVALKQLENSEANLYTIFDNTETGYALLDDKHHIISFNQTIYHFSEDQLDKPFEKGNNLLDALKNGRHHELKASVENALKGIYSKFELNYAGDGEPGKWYSVTCSPVQDAGKQVLGAIISERDITRKKVLELQEKKMTQDLLQRNNDLEQFAYIVSHNLRAPVATILGITSLFNDELIGEGEIRDFMGSMATAVQNLDNVIIDLNTIINAKSTHNKKKEPVVFAQLIAEVAQSLQSLADETVQIHTNFSAVQKMTTIKSYMHSVFQNLISNSIKYRKPGERLQIEICSRKDTGKMELCFKDNGIGIDMKKRGSQIFGLYKRFHTDLAEGKGLGLYMVKTQVETLGGRITVCSKEHEGTEFCIEFPLSE